MPGYLSNRYVSFDPPTPADLALVESNLSTNITANTSAISDINTRLTEAESNIDDLSLNIGV
jgi:hypothetical protein